MMQIIILKIILYPEPNPDPDYLIISDSDPVKPIISGPNGSGATTLCLNYSSNDIW
jgi:hypothetical protein